MSWTLEQIAEHGKDGFYKGPVAEKIIETNKKYGGLISQADLDAYTPKWREPISGTFNEYSIFSMSPPSSGGIHVVQILNILEALETLNPEKMFSPQNINLTTQAMQKAFADRASYLGDSDFVNVPVQGLTFQKLRFRDCKIHFKTKSHSIQRSFFPETRCLLSLPKPHIFPL